MVQIPFLKQQLLSHISHPLKAVNRQPKYHCEDISSMKK